jgi:phosphate transport system protein
MIVTRVGYTKQLNELSEHFARLGQQVIADINASALAVCEADAGAAKGIVEARRTSERLRRLIEDSCMSLMLLQQPLARDLRLVTSSFRAVTDLSRIDEMCSDIAVLSLELPAGAVAPVSQIVGRLAEGAATMVERATTAFLVSDGEMAEGVFATDDAVDVLYDQARTAVVSALRADGDDGEGLPELLMVAKYYERMGDHAQGIADWAVFNATGMYRGRGIGEVEDE